MKLSPKTQTKKMKLSVHTGRRTAEELQPKDTKLKNLKQANTSENCQRQHLAHPATTSNYSQLGSPWRWCLMVNGRKNYGCLALRLKTPKRCIAHKHIVRILNATNQQRQKLSQPRCILSKRGSLLRKKQQTIANTSRSVSSKILTATT